MEHPGIWLRGDCISGPEFVYMQNLSGHIWKGGWIVLGSEKWPAHTKWETDCEKYIAHEVLHSLLAQMFPQEKGLINYALDDLREKYRGDSEHRWIFEEI